MDSLISARAPKLKSSWDREQALFSMKTSRSSTHDRLYADAQGAKRTARALRARERARQYRPEPKVKPEGYEGQMREFESKLWGS